MELPEIITRLPAADLPFPPDKVRSNVVPSAHGQVVFFQIIEDVEIPTHSHKGQWGSVLEGQVELTIGDETRVLRPGSSYYIPAGALHSAKLQAGTKVVDFFEEADRYRLK